MSGQFRPPRATRPGHGHSHARNRGGLLQKAPVIETPRTAEEMAAIGKLTAWAADNPAPDLKMFETQHTAVLVDVRSKPNPTTALSLFLNELSFNLIDMGIGFRFLLHVPARALGRSGPALAVACLSVPLREIVTACGHDARSISREINVEEHLVESWLCVDPFLEHVSQILHAVGVFHEFLLQPAVGKPLRALKIDYSPVAIAPPINSTRTDISRPGDNLGRLLRGAPKGKILRSTWLELKADDIWPEDLSIDVVDGLFASFKHKLHIAWPDKFAGWLIIPGIDSLRLLRDYASLPDGITHDCVGQMTLAEFSAAAGVRYIHSEPYGKNPIVFDRLQLTAELAEKALKQQVNKTRKEARSLRR